MFNKVEMRIESLEKVKWVENASYWQLPAEKPATSDKDAFMLGGNGRVSARMGMQPEYTTIDRFMGPEYDSYSYHQNNYFRKSSVSISVDNPHDCITEQQRLWRVPGTTIMCSSGRVRLENKHSGNVILHGIEIATVNYVLPNNTALLRLIAVKNGSSQKVENIRLALDAVPDIPWPKPGHCSVIEPHGGGRLLEKVTEFERIPGRPLDKKFYSDTRVQRYRYCLRGLVGGSNRGFEQLASEAFDLGHGEDKLFLAYMAVSPDGAVKGAENVESEILAEVEKDGIFTALNRARQWWRDWNSEGTRLTCPDTRVNDFLDAAAVHQKQAEHHTGGFMVGDDYTQCFVRDCNGSHLNLLDTGHFKEVCDSMEFFFRMDAGGGEFANSYALDLGKSHVEPEKSYWFEDPDLTERAYEDKDNVLKECGETSVSEMKRRGFITPGDVPNFRILWHWWYHLRTGNLELIEQRWNYLRALVRLQRFEEYDFLAGFSRDETYGMGPVHKLRRGDSADNSFIALAAVKSMTGMAKRLDKSEDAAELSTLAARIENAIEEKLWVENAGHYAMRITPEGELDSQSCSPGLLRPLWIGAIGPDNDRVAKSVEYVLENMMLEHGFIKIISGDFDATCGHFPAYLLVSLCKLDHPAAEKAFDDLMRYVNPGGTCAEYYDFAAPCPKPHLHRGRNWETGINADAVLYYLTGFEPDVYTKSFSLKPHLPSDWGGFKVERMRMGGALIYLEAKAHNRKIVYRITHKGDEPLTMNARFIVPASWDYVSLSVNGDQADCTVEGGRYSVKTIPFKMTLLPNAEIVVEIGA